MQCMVQMTIDVPEVVLGSLHEGPASFARELRRAAPAKSYNLGHISQGRGAEISGISRQEFLAPLAGIG